MREKTATISSRRIFGGCRGKGKMSRERMFAAATAGSSGSQLMTHASTMKAKSKIGTKGDTRHPVRIRFLAARAKLGSAPLDKAEAFEWYRNLAE
jgi:hypothetical protein